MVKVLVCVLFFLWGSAQASKLWTIPTQGGPKQTEVSICRHDAPIKRIPIPRRPDCHEFLMSKNRTTPRPIVFTVLRPDLRLLTIPVAFCKKINYKSTCFENFFGAISLELTQEVERLSRQDCEHLHRQEFGDEIWKNKEGRRRVRGEKKEAECNWLTTHEVHSSETILLQGEGIYDREHDAIRHGMPVGQLCPASSGECRGPDGIMFWDHSNIPSKCFFIPHTDAVGTVSWEGDGKRLILSSASAGLLFMFSLMREVRTEGCLFDPASALLSDEGVPVLFHHDPNVTVRDLLRLTKEQWVLMTNESHRASAHPLTSIGLTLDIPKINAALKDLANTAEAILRTTEHKLCKLNELEWETAWALKDLSPQSAVRIFTRNTRSVGYFQGPFIYYAECSGTFNWTLEIKGQCGNSWRMTVPKGICLLNARELGTPCPKECPNKGPMSFIVSVNKTHSVDMHMSPLTPFPHGAFFSPAHVSVNEIHVSGTPYLSVQELIETGSMTSIVRSLSYRIENLEAGVNGNFTWSGEGDYMTGSPTLYAGLGFAAGKMSSLGGTIWTMVYLSAGLVWAVMMVRIVSCIWNMKKRDEKIPRPRTRRASSAQEAETLF